MTIHDFDLARFFLGDVVSVQALGANLIEPYIQQAGDIDTAVVLLLGANGATCSITALVLADAASESLRSGAGVTVEPVTS